MSVDVSLNFFMINEMMIFMGYSAKSDENI